MQIISSRYGAPVILQANGTPVVVNNGSLETRSGAFEISQGGGVFPTFGGGYRQQAIVNTSNGGAVTWTHGHKFVASALDGQSVHVNGVVYAFTFVSDTEGTLDPNPGDQTNVPFRLADYTDIGTLAFGNGTGYRYVIGTNNGGFTPLFRFHDTGALELPNGVLLRTGTGSPEGLIAAPIGSLWLRADGDSESALYVKASGSGPTGWISVLGVLSESRFPALTGDVTTEEGSVATTVQSVGGSAAADVHAAEVAANEATASAIGNKIAKRDVNGNFFIAQTLIFGEGAARRWLLDCSAAGNDLSVYRYDDAGAYAGGPVQIKRATGAVALDSLTASMPVKTNASKELVSGLIDLATEVTGTLSDVSLPALTGDVTSEAGGGDTTVVSVGGSAAADVHAAEVAANEATASAVPNKIAKRDSNGNFFISQTLIFGEGAARRWLLDCSAAGNDLSVYRYDDAGAYAGGPVQIKRATGAVVFDSLTASMPVKTNASKELVSGNISLSSEVTGTLQAAQAPALTGDVTSGAGSLATTVAAVGGSSAADVHAAEQLANAATSANTANAIVRRSSGGSFYGTSMFASTSVGVGGGGNGSVNVILGGSTTAGYIEWRTGSGTRLGYFGNGSAHMALVLENGAAFTISGGGVYAYRPVNAAFGVVTCDGVQTLTNKSIAATQLTGTLQPAQHPALTGDVTCSAGSTATTLATVVAPGTYNYVTVDAKGRVVGGSYVGYMLGGNNLSEVTNAATARANIGAAKVGGAGTTTLTLAKITPGGVNGSISFNSDGVVVGYAQPT